MGLNPNDLKGFIGDIKTVINASSTYDKDNLENVNIIGSENVIAFCKRYNKRLLHISTTNISGDSKREKKPKTRTVFSETNLYIGQNLDDRFSLSKFKAEFKILEEIGNGLDAQIIRLRKYHSRLRLEKFEDEEKYFFT